MAAAVVTAEAVVAGLTEVADACARFDPDLLPAVELGELLEAVQRHTNRIDAAVLAWTASFDRRNGARASGHRNTQHFLQDRLRLTPGAAKARTDAARALANGFDDTREALERGDISEEHAAAIVRGAGQVGRRRGDGDDDQRRPADGEERRTVGPDDGEEGGGEAQGGHMGDDDGTDGSDARDSTDTDDDVEGSLLAAARGGDATQVRRQARQLAHQTDPGDAERRARSAYRQRHLSVRHDGATTWLEGNLHQAAGERFLARLQALADRTGPDDDRSYGQRLADALIEVCDGSVANGMQAGGDARPGPSRNGTGRSRRQGAGGGVVAVVPLETIERRAGAPPGSLLFSGPCPAESIAEAVCKAGLSWLITGADGQPLAYGTARRVATTAQRAALTARDGGCRWPGCRSRPLYTVAHHEPPHGRPGWGTDVDTMVLLCEFHHGLRHHGGWRLRLDPDGIVTVTSPDRTTVRTETPSQARARHGMPSGNPANGPPRDAGCRDRDAAGHDAAGHDAAGRDAAGRDAAGRGAPCGGDGDMARPCGPEGDPTVSESPPGPLRFDFDAAADSERGFPRPHPPDDSVRTGIAREEKATYRTSARPPDTTGRAQEQVARGRRAGPRSRARDARRAGPESRAGPGSRGGVGP